MGDAFQAGINAFLKKYAYANAVTKDLWAELTLSWEGNHPEEEKVQFTQVAESVTLLFKGRCSFSYVGFIFSKII